MSIKFWALSPFRWTYFHIIHGFIFFYFILKEFFVFYFGCDCSNKITTFINFMCTNQRYLTCSSNVNITNIHFQKYFPLQNWKLVSILKTPIDSSPNLDNDNGVTCSKNKSYNLQQLREQGDMTYRSTCFILLQVQINAKAPKLHCSPMASPWGEVFSIPLPHIAYEEISHRSGQEGRSLRPRCALWETPKELNSKHYTPCPIQKQKERKNKEKKKMNEWMNKKKVDN